MTAARSRSLTSRISSSDRATRFLVIYDVGHYQFDEANNARPRHRRTSSQSRAHRLRRGMGQLPQIDQDQRKDLIVIPTGAFRSFIDGLGHYDLSLFWFNSHDDCYFTVVATELIDVARFAGRLLASFVECIARRCELDINVADPPPEIRERLTGSEAGWTAGANQGDGHGRRDPDRPQQRGLDPPRPKPPGGDARASYKISTGAWRSESGTPEPGRWSCRRTRASVLPVPHVAAPRSLESSARR